jgi:opacity protein-like surface antigen
LTHLSPELEFAPWTRYCPTLSFHIGAGAYRDETGDVKFGFNAGAGLAVCLSRRLSFLSRYDYRSVHALSRDYSTLQIGLRFLF